MRLFRRRQLDYRRIPAAGILCLFAGLMLALFEVRYRPEPLAIFHGLPLLLVGVAVILFSRSLRRTGGSGSRA
jgi:hypothetical protein